MADNYLEKRQQELAEKRPQKTATEYIQWHFYKRKRMTSKAILRARNQSRTDTSFRTLPPESSASTNSAIRASFWDCKYTHFF